MNSTLSLKERKATFAELKAEYLFIAIPFSTFNFDKTLYFNMARDNHISRLVFSIMPDLWTNNI